MKNWAVSKGKSCTINNIKEIRVAQDNPNLPPQDILGQQADDSMTMVIIIYTLTADSSNSTVGLRLVLKISTKQDLQIPDQYKNVTGSNIPSVIEVQISH